jgi:hypothetical protein
MQQAVILCEGFDDRAFLAEWLVGLGCQEARQDPWKNPSRPGSTGSRAQVAGSILVRLR